MINSDNIIDFNRTDAELEELIMFLICTAGKSAKRTEKLLGEFLAGYEEFSPFEVVKLLDESDFLEKAIKLQGFGCYTRITRAFYELANSGINLRTCTLEDLMKIHGIGRKSASCFLMWTRDNQRLVALDTHILQWLREQGYDAPKSTPSSKKQYDYLEKVFLDLADKAGMNPVEMDLEIWISKSLR